MTEHYLACVRSWAIFLPLTGTPPTSGLGSKLIGIFPATQVSFLFIQLSDFFPQTIRLNIPNLGIEDKYRWILEKFGADIDLISKLYSKQKDDPPLGRDQPPVAGQILWARQLFHRIEQPMQLFQQHPKVLQSVGAKPVIRSYNRLAKVLLEFEVLYHRAWLQQVGLFLLFFQGFPWSNGQESLFGHGAMLFM